MAVAYLVTGPAWEYNDEYNYTGEGETVVKLFRKKDDADRCALELTLKNLEEAICSEDYYEFNLNETRRFIEELREEHEDEKNGGHERAAMKLLEYIRAKSHERFPEHEVREMEIE